MAANMVVLESEIRGPKSEVQSPNCKVRYCCSGTHEDLRPSGQARPSRASVTSSHAPPLASILARAAALNACALTVSLRVSSPPPRILMPAPRPFASPALRKAASSTRAPSSKRFSASRFTGRYCDGMAGVVKSALGNAPDQGHLPTFETNPNRAAGPGRLALAAAPAGLAVAAGFALAQSLATVPGAGTRFKIM